MQVPPEPTKSAAASNTDSGSTSLDSVQPTFPAYPPPTYQMPQPGYGPQLTAQGQYGFAAQGQVPSVPYGNPQWCVYQPHPQSSQNAQVNVVAAPAAAPIIIAQPAMVQVSPPSYLGWSIFNLLCCFWPLGLAAIIFSVKVGSARTAEEARRHSLTARNLNISATVIAPILVSVILGVYFGVGYSYGKLLTYTAYALDSSYYYSSSYSYSYRYYYTYSYKAYRTYYG